MATIFERSIQYADDKCGCKTCKVMCKTYSRINMDGTCDEYNKYRKLYVKIATEQREIDIKAAENVYCKELCRVYSNCKEKTCDLSEKYKNRLRKAIEKGGEV